MGISIEGYANGQYIFSGTMEEVDGARKKLYNSDRTYRRNVDAMNRQIQINRFVDNVKSLVGKIFGSESSEEVQ